MAATDHVIALPSRYSVLRRIATGGMATVWSAEDRVLGRTVAVKVLAPALAEDEAAHARFLREARAGARLSDHPHVVTVYDLGEHEGQVFMVMEEMRGGALAGRLGTGRRPPLRLALRWLAEAAAALDHAHAHDIVHRDVKPANLLLDERNRLAVADFGIASVAGEATVTQTGLVLGTASYLAPEQAMGRPATAASDRYSLAVVAFELLTGRRLFDVEGPAQQARAHVEQEPVAVTSVVDDLPPAVDVAIRRGLAKDPEDRPLTASAFVDELCTALGPDCEREQDETATQVMAPVPVPASAPLLERTPTPRPAPRRPVPAAAARAAARTPTPLPAYATHARRSPWPAVLAGLAALVLLGAVAAALLAGGGEDPSRSADRGAATAEPSGEQRASTAERTAETQAQQQETAPPPTTAAPETTPAPAAGTPSGSPAELNDRGYARLQAGDAAGALPLLRASVQGYRDAGDTRSLGYAFALFNLARALRLTGSPAEAVPLLEERLAFSDNQRGTVERELEAARAAAGSGGEGGEDSGDGGGGKGTGKAGAPGQAKKR